MPNSSASPIPQPCSRKLSESALRAPARESFRSPPSSFSAFRFPAFRFSRTGFTLIELLVVISIIAILAGLLLTITGKARQSRVLSRAKAELGEVQMAIDSFKTKLGYYPVADTNFPGINALFYELMGTSTTNIGGTTYYMTLDKNQVTKVDPTTITNVFRLGGFMNCTRDISEDATRAAAAFLPHRTENQNYLLLTFTNASIVADTSSHNAVAVLGSMVEGPIMWAGSNGKQINPWRYNSANPTNNPGSYDLWIDVVVGNKTNRISNWSTVPQIVSYAPTERGY